MRNMKRKIVSFSLFVSSIPVDCFCMAVPELEVVGGWVILSYFHLQE